MLKPSYPITTARLVIRPFTMDDLDDLHAIQSREDVTRYLYWGPQSRAEVADKLAKRTGTPGPEQEGDLLLAVELRDSGVLIGRVNLAWDGEERRQGEFGFVFHPDHHGHGYAGEAAVEMLRLGFEGLGLHRIVGRADGRNKASARVMEKLGMRREAYFVQNEFVKGEWTDEVVYAMLAREWANR
jgi:RimJ/RimL family protein N-acetyltransferase